MKALRPVIPMVAAAVLLLFPASLKAELSLEGVAEQGGVMVGRTLPGAQVVLDGEAVRVDEQGRFLIGFGRDAEETAVLRVTLPGGESVTRRLAVASRDWPVQRIDGLPRRQVTPPRELIERIRRDAAMIAEARRIDTEAPLFLEGLMRPSDGPVSSPFGVQRILNGEPRAPHSGTDYAAPEGSPVLAAGHGVVSLVHEDMFFTGKTVMIDHGHRLASVYAHLSRIDVEEGQRVEKGETIGAIGATGRATGAHLHFGVSWGQTRLDPETVLSLLE